MLGIIPIFCEELFSEIEVKRGQSTETEYQVSWKRTESLSTDLVQIDLCLQDSIIAICLILIEILPEINYSLWSSLILHFNWLVNSCMELIFKGGFCSQEKPSTSQNHCYGKISHFWVPCNSAFNELFQLAVVSHQSSMSDIHRKHTKIMGKILVAGKHFNNSRGKLGPGEKPSWGETRSSGIRVSHPGQESWSVSPGEAHIP